MKSKDDILKLVTDLPYGIRKKAVVALYEDAESHLQQLLDKRLLLQVSLELKNGEDYLIVANRHPKLTVAGVTPEMCDDFRAIGVADDIVTFERDLTKHKLARTRMEPRPVQRRERKTAKRRAQRNINVQNTHMEGFDFNKAYVQEDAVSRMQKQSERVIKYEQLLDTPEIFRKYKNIS